jgi:hypothetical protein
MPNPNSEVVRASHCGNSGNLLPGGRLSAGCGAMQACTITSFLVGECGWRRRESGLKLSPTRKLKSAQRVGATTGRPMCDGAGEWWRRESSIHQCTAGKAVYTAVHCCTLCNLEWLGQAGTCRQEEVGTAPGRLSLHLRHNFLTHARAGVPKPMWLTLKWTDI